MPMIEIKDTHIYYEIHGEGIPLVMVHGLGSSHHFFRDQIPFFQKTHRVIVLDLRGNGNSGKLTVPIKDILKTQCEDLQQLLGHLKISSALFLGVSYGGCLIQLFANLYPEKVKGLIISDSFCSIKPKNLGEFFIYLELHNVIEHYLPKFILRYATRKALKPWPRAIEHLDHIIQHMRRTEMARQRLALDQICYNAFLPKIHVPTLGIVGSCLAIEVKFMEEIINLIPHAQLAIISDSLHVTNWCQPQKFNKTVHSFLQEKGLY